MKRTFIIICFKQKTAYEMRISDWSSDVCSSDLSNWGIGFGVPWICEARVRGSRNCQPGCRLQQSSRQQQPEPVCCRSDNGDGAGVSRCGIGAHRRSEEHTSELQSLMRISYAVFCLKQKNTPTTTAQHADAYKHTDCTTHT